MTSVKKALLNPFQSYPEGRLDCLGKVLRGKKKGEGKGVKNRGKEKELKERGIRGSGRKKESKGKRLRDKFKEIKNMR